MRANAGGAGAIAPPVARPYLRLARIDRPIGTWLLLIPCWWGTASATSSLPVFDWFNLILYILFAVGALVMRGAGCCWNDIMDRDFDAEVARTTLRPIANGDLTVRQALTLMALLMLIGLAVLLPMGPVAVMVAIASLALVVIYPLMKRVTHWPQFFLGLAFNWGILVAWASVTGVKSTALKFEENTKPWLWGFYALTVVLIAAAGWSTELGWPFYALLALGAAQLVWQLINLDFDDPVDCLAKFKSNRYFGFIVLAGFLTG